jgi:hypothetical protein
MSLFRNITLGCPACGTKVGFEAVHSVNVDRRPPLRDEILAETFQRQTCPACDLDFRCDPEFHYVDVGRHQWVAALPLAKLAGWQEAEQHAHGLFERVYGAQASAHTREVGKQLVPRVTFGWAALREKVLAAGHGLDDVTLELCKAAVLRGSEEAPLSAETELRLVDVNAEGLVLAWMLTEDESPGDMLQVERSLYDEIAADADGDWAALRIDLARSTYVDLNRLMMAV